MNKLTKFILLSFIINSHIKQTHYTHQTHVFIKMSLNYTIHYTKYNEYSN